MAFRRDNGALFSEGEFVALPTNGRRAEHVAAFGRNFERTAVIAIVPRWLNRAGAQNFSVRDPKFWGNTEISIPSGFSGKWLNILTGETLTVTGNKRKQLLRASQVFQCFPGGPAFFHPRKPSKEKTAICTQGVNQ